MIIDSTQKTVAAACLLATLTCNSIAQDATPKPQADAPSSTGSGHANSQPALPQTPAVETNSGLPALSYYALMNMPFKTRLELLERYPEAVAQEFMYSLSGARRAVVATDPNDCGRAARVMRASYANSAPDGGIVSNTLQDIGQSVLGSFLGSAGSVLSGAATINEGRKFLAYKDICDASREEREALLSPRPDDAYQQAEPKKTEDTAVDKASRFFAR